MEKLLTLSWWAQVINSNGDTFYVNGGNPDVSGGQL